jgi:hypothetical protein
MKSEDEVQEALDDINIHEGSNYPGMTYEDGLLIALQWVLEQVSDEEFER